MSSSVKIAVAMSGGVDSSVAALLATKDNKNALGVTMSVFEGSAKQDSVDAAAVAKQLGFEHVTLDLSEEFRETVMRYFADSYIAGETPNPCVFCNKAIKFGALLDRVNALGCDIIATGHYARTKKDASGRVLLEKAVFTEKDQSYVLWQLSQKQLASARFPLGEYTKPQVREIAAEYGFASSNRPDSQDICFVPDGNYRGFIEEFTGRIFPEGDFVGTDGKLWGRHSGLIGYTVGQRKGLGISAPAPLYVIRKNVEENRVYLGAHEELFSTRVELSDLNLIAVERLDAPLRVTAKTRYSQKESAATISQTGEGTAVLEFDEPQRAVTIGQSAVFYSGDTVVGGGIIV
ncbi:MAG: tRNA 2-thiouridine(34) synthase MnmA [Clostridia bacterium]|nr:tRNA 2-thiouridine(34) synthase MnmA [Clostridia bacterium]